MDKRRKARIEKLAAIAYDKKLIFNAMGISAASSDPVIAKEQKIAYEVARTEWTDAERNLRAVQQA